MGVDDDNETNSERHAPAQGVKDAEAVRKAELPLTGVVLCCTSLTQDVRVGHMNLFSVGLSTDILSRLSYQTLRVRWVLCTSSTLHPT